MAKFRKKPVVIEAVRWMTYNYNEICEFLNYIPTSEDGMGSTLIITTLEGEMTCLPFDWIIKGIKGEFYPCKPDIFELTYEFV